MPTDTRTSARNYPKPYPSNLLAEDVVRLRDALDAIDTDMNARPDTATVNGLITTAVNNILDGAPAALDSLNELAAALSDDANFASTITTAIAAKLGLAGGTMTGAINMGSNGITNLAAPSAGTDAATKAFVESTDSARATATTTAINDATAALPSLGLVIALG